MPLMCLAPKFQMLHTVLGTSIVANPLGAEASQNIIKLYILYMIRIADSYLRFFVINAVPFTLAFVTRSHRKLAGDH